MKQIIQHETYGEIIFEESFWTGRKSLIVGGVPLEKITKKEFRLQDGTVAVISGGFFQGASVSINGEIIKLTPSIKWYEIVLALIPFVLNLIWGNIVALVQIFPVVGGAIGGGVSALIAMVGLIFIKSVKNIWLKILIALVATAVAFAVCGGIGYAVLGALT